MYGSVYGFHQSVATIFLAQELEKSTYSMFRVIHTMAIHYSDDYIGRRKQ